MIPHEKFIKTILIVKYHLFYKLKNPIDLNELYLSVKSQEYPLKSHISDNYP